MYDNQGKIRKIVCITAGIWLISLLIFVLLCGKLIEKPPLVWISACTGYGIWNLCIFGCGYWAIRRTINRTMNGINACIQHLIDGQKKAVLWNGRRIFFGEISKPDLEAV